VPNETIQVAVDGAVATITLDRPDVANAISPQMRDELENALAELRPGDRVRVIRVRGAGRSFCSGYDLASGSSVYNAGLPASGVPRPDAGQAAPTELGESSIVLDRERLRDSIERWLRIWNYRKPIVAQVHGACLSGALDLIGVCDLVYAAENARFGHPAARGLGIPPTMGMLPAKIGAARTKELFFTGDTIDGHEAFRLGLVNAVIPDPELDERTAALCRRIAHTPLDALTLHKHVINRWSEIAGLRLGALEGADFDAMFHLTSASVMFGRIADRDGIRAALNWRDEAFGED
jgi:enoyl-CoA hydratase/carnithine racemase